jgi:hypothetical protein
MVIVFGSAAPAGILNAADCVLSPDVFLSPVSIAAENGICQSRIAAGSATDIAGSM